MIAMQELGLDYSVVNVNGGGVFAAGLI